MQGLNSLIVNDATLHEMLEFYLRSKLLTNGKKVCVMSVVRDTTKITGAQTKIDFKLEPDSDFKKIKT